MTEYAKTSVRIPETRAFVVCKDCGSLVLNQEAHTEWHEDINHISRQADHADAHTRIIV